MRFFFFDTNFSHVFISGSYGYKVYQPEESPIDMPRYNFDYQLELPVAQRYGGGLLQGLTSNVDKMLIPNEGTDLRLR